MNPTCATCNYSAVVPGQDGLRLCSVRGTHVSARYYCRCYAAQGSVPRGDDAPTERESDLLAACLKALRDRAYYAATPDNHVAAATGKIQVRGFYCHLNGDVRHQPQLPDILVLPWQWRNNVVGCDRPPLLVELKVAGPRGGKPRYQPGQRELIDCGYWCECRTVDGFTAALAAWEMGA